MWPSAYARSVVVPGTGLEAVAVGVAPPATVAARCRAFDGDPMAASGDEGRVVYMAASAGGSAARKLSSRSLAGAVGVDAIVGLRPARTRTMLARSASSSPSSTSESESLPRWSSDVSELPESEPLRSIAGLLDVASARTRGLVAIVVLEVVVVVVLVDTLGDEVEEHVIESITSGDRTDGSDEDACNVMAVIDSPDAIRARSSGRYTRSITTGSDGTLRNDAFFLS